jgi:hypothetical protein
VSHQTGDGRRPRSVCGEAIDQGTVSHHIPSRNLPARACHVPAFDEPRFIRNTFSVNLPRRLDIRRFAERFEQVLEGNYGPAQVTPIPDEMDPLLPRLLFSSTHGFSQILASQVNISFVVTYSDDWQTNQEMREEYVKDRARYLFSLSEILGTKVLFCGLTTDVRITSLAADSDILSLLRRTLLCSSITDDLHDIMVRVGIKIGDRFFSNTTIANFRSWESLKIAQETRTLVPLPSAQATQHGILVNDDFNDRYSYNERDNYSCDYDTAKELLGVAFPHLQERIRRILGDVQ